MSTASATAVLDELLARPAEQGRTLAVLARRGGETIVERYGARPATDRHPETPVGPDTALVSWSMAKTITDAAVGVLVGDGRLELDRPAPVPEWAGTDKAAITLRHLLEMRSGLRFVEDYVDGSISHCIEMLFGGTDPSHGRYAARQDLIHPPGEVFSYSSGTTNIVCRIVGDVVAPDADGPAERRAAVEAFLDERLLGPAGMTGATARFDGAGDLVGSSYVDATALDFARFGELLLHDGVADAGRGARVLPAGWADSARVPTAHDDETGFDYGRHVWIWPAFPGSWALLGYQGQITLVLPDHDLVLVHLGLTDVAHAPGLNMRLARLAERLAAEGAGER